MSIKRADVNNIDFGTMIVAGAPAITSFVYPTGRSSVNVDESTYITIYGANFLVGCTVRIGDSVASIVTFRNSGELYFEAPYLPAGTYRLLVVNPDGQYAVSLPGLIYTNYAVWTTPSGLLGTISESRFEKQLISTGATYSVYEGTLPPGYTLTSTGFLSGSLTVNPVVNQTWNFTISVLDQYGSTSTRNFYLRFLSTPVVWVTAGDDLPLFTEAPYIQGILATSNSPVTYSVILGGLPGGMTLSSTGLITGTPDDVTKSLRANTVFRFTVRAIDQELQFADQDFVMLYQPTAPIWTTSSYVQGYRAGEPVVLLFNAYSNSTVTYTVESGFLPNGTSLNPVTGIVSGTAVAVELETAYTFVIRATDREGHFASVSNTLTVFSYPMTATSTGTLVLGRNTSIHTFTTAGTFTVTDSPPNSYATVIIIGGGGGGGAANGGGGGAGGFIYIGAMRIPVGVYNITIGGGGAGATDMGAGAPYGGDGVVRSGLSGFSSAAFGNTAIGGGLGAKGDGTGVNGGGGGSGGGGGGRYNNAANPVGVGGQGFAINGVTQGYAGGTGQTNAGGGGGGAGGAGGTSGGGAGITLPFVGGNAVGGANAGGTASGLTAWGGGGGGTNSFAFQNQGITRGTNGTTYGSGGGGGAGGFGGYAYYTYAAGGGNGFNGVVIIRYPYV